VRGISIKMQTQKSPTYLKAITLRDYSDLHTIKEDIKKGMILVLRVTPLAQKNVDELRKAVEEIYNIAKNNDADIARLGEERIIVTPPGVKIWRAEYDLK
jgi:SepF-like predicted cell division protein (DUF552 family)